MRAARFFWEGKAVVKLTDETVMTFGLHKGQKLGDINAGYLLWLLKELSDDFRVNLFRYLSENEEALRQEVGDDQEDAN